MRAAADAARRRAGRPAPELARRVDVAQERPQHAAPTTSTFVRLGSPSPSNGREPGPRAHQRIVDDLDERRRDRASPRGRRGSVDSRQIAPPEITPASWPSSAARRLGREDHRRLAGRDLARAQLGDRAARRLEADLLGVAPARPRSATRSSRSRCASCRRRRRTAARRRATRACRGSRAREPGRASRTPTRRRAPEDRALGVGDALVELAAPPPRPRARAGSPSATSTRQHRLVPQVQVGDVARHLLARPAVAALVGLGERRQLDLSRAKRSSAAAVRSDVYVTAGALILEHAQAERAAARLLDQLGLAEPDLHLQLGAVAHQHLGAVGAAP